MLKRFWAVLVARNKEFYRDKATLGWNLGFPFVILVGFAFIFGGQGQSVFKVAVLGEVPEVAADDTGFFATQHVQFVPVDDLEGALRRVGQHRFDLLFDPGSAKQTPRYWINSTSPKGYLVEKVLLGSQPPAGLARQTVEGREVRYIDWFLPGLLGMNIMFSCLFGVGYVIVRYRKNGMLRRLKATPLNAFEFLTAQVASRFLLVMVTTLIVYLGAHLILDIQMLGSHVTLFLIFGLGTVCLIALGLLLASRTASEELAGGLLNIMTWPMMILSGVWFSLDGAPVWLQRLAQALPLTHINDAARSIATDGAGLLDLLPQIAFLAVMSLAFLIAGAWAFRWE